MHLARLVGIGALLVCRLATSASAQESQLKGQVTDERTGDPITGARVLLVGTSRIETTGQDGSYLFRALSPGDHQVRVVAIGFSAQVKPFTVAPGELSALDFSMTPVPVQLDEIVTTATGQQSRLEIGTLELDPTPDPVDQATAIDLLFRERAFWLFLTGHRLGDLRRLVRQYGRPADTVFPSGLYFKGGQTYGPGGQSATTGSGNQQSEGSRLSGPERVA